MKTMQLTKIAEIADYWESCGYSREDALEIGRMQIEDIQDEQEFNLLFDQGALCD